MGRKKDRIWDFFNCELKQNNVGKWAVCKNCKVGMQGVPDRMKVHYNVCSNQSQDVESQDDFSDSNINKPTLSSKKAKIGLEVFSDSAFIRTSPAYEKAISKQIAKYFIATNTPFHHASHPEFVKLCSLIRPGYIPPSEYQIGGPMLDEVHSELLEESKLKFKDQTVTMALDGWSNVRNEPIVCCSITNDSGDSLLVETIDTSGNAHTGEYLTEIAQSAIEKCEQNFSVKIRSFVTDNAQNVALMRRNLVQNDDLNLIQYGCNAHILNLLSGDLEIQSVQQKVMKVIKYFKNKHLPAACYKAAKGKKLVTPIEVRWNTIYKAVQSFLSNRGILVQICQDRKTEIDADIFKIVNDIKLANNSEEFLSRIKPIGIALDRAQSDNCTIAVAVEIWYKLGVDLEKLGSVVQRAFKSRQEMALKPIHFLANMIDHRFRGMHLNETQKAAAYEYLASINEDFLPLLMSHIIGEKPMPQYLYATSFRKTRPIIWWKSVNIENSDSFNWKDLKKGWLELCEQVLTGCASTAGVERIFSSFGLVQSKLRNRLGNEKASKLTFMFKYMNQKDKSKKFEDLEWIWNEGINENEDSDSGDSDSEEFVEVSD